MKCRWRWWTYKRKQDYAPLAVVGVLNEVQVTLVDTQQEER